MTTADRCQACALVSGGVALATGAPWLWHTTVVLLWLAVMHLTGDIRSARRRTKQRDEAQTRHLTRLED